MKTPATRTLATATISAYLLLDILSPASAQEAPDWRSDEFTLASTQFKDDGKLPISAISNYPLNGVNQCSIDGSAGGNQSPELHWTNAPRETKSFALVVYDATAAVVHWGIYNISSKTNNLPENAGISDSPYGEEVSNVFSDLSYDGPCPPPGVAPDAHAYVFTLYALDTDIHVYSSANFPPSALTLYRDLLDTSRQHHILASASITGYYSTTP